MKKLSKLLALVMSICLLLTSVPALSVAEETYREPITLTVFSELANHSGEQAGWFGKIIKDRFNVTLNFVSTNLDANAYAASVAAGNLGDMVTFGDTSGHFLECIDAGLVMDWSDLDMTPYTNIEKWTLASQQKVSDFVKEQKGVDGIWGFVHDIGMEDNAWADLVNPGYALQVRYDAWVKAGKPELNSLADLPAFAKALQDAMPENEAGEKVYAYAGFPDWEDCVMKFTWDLMTFYGYQEFDFMGVNYSKGTVVNPLEENSLYYQALKANNEMYRMGLFDPDSVSQNFDTYTQKLAAGRYIMALWGWIINNYNNAERSANENGYVTFQIGDSAPVMQTISTTGGNRLWCLGADCAYPERAMEIIDWLCTEEGIIVSNYGPQGLTWDYGADGVPYGTEFGWTCWENKKETEMPAEYGGGTFEDGECKFNNTTLKIGQTIVGKTYSFDKAGWPDGIARDQTNLSKAWSENYASGAKTGVELYRTTGKVSVAPAASSVYVKVELSEDGKAKRALFAPVMKQYSWKCVYAETVEEFDSLWNEMVTTCKSYGYDDVVAEKMIDIEKCLDFIGVGLQK